jgi:hypothetical protein
VQIQFTRELICLHDPGKIRGGEVAILYRTRDAETGAIDKLPVLCDEEPHDVVEILVLTAGICLFDDRFQPPVDHIE